MVMPSLLTKAALYCSPRLPCTVWRMRLPKLSKVTLQLDKWQTYLINKQSITRAAPLSGLFGSLILLIVGFGEGCFQRIMRMESVWRMVQGSLVSRPGMASIYLTYVSKMVKWGAADPVQHRTAGAWQNGASVSRCSVGL